MNWRVDMQFSADTIRLIETSSYLIQEYLLYENPDAIINSYFEERKDWPTEGVTDQLYHLMPWDVACTIYYTQALGGHLGFVGKWQTDNGLSRPPEEVIEYLKRNFFGVKD